MYMAQLQEVTQDPVDNSGPIFDDEPTHKVQNNNDNYNVFAMKNEHPEQPESCNDIYLTEQGDFNITIDSLGEIRKKQEVEDHRRKFKFSNNKTSVTACNDSLNAKTSNVNFVCVTCGKCVLNDNHDLCVLHYINGVNSRTRQPMAMPISTREPKHNVNQSVATSIRMHVCGIEVIHHLDQMETKSKRNVPQKLVCSREMISQSSVADLYSITLQDTTTPNPICLMAKQHRLKHGYGHHDYSRYTWTHFLRTKDETSGVLIDFLILVQRGLHAQVTTIRTDKGTEFLNKTLHAYLAKEGIRHETSTA
ncbi:gag-pol polyprotein [Tanacetum coccineum]